MRTSTFRFAPKRSAMCSPLAHPVLAGALLAVLLSGCAATQPEKDDMDPGMAQASSSSSAMEQDEDDIMDDDAEETVASSSASTMAPSSQAPAAAQNSKPASQAAAIDTKKKYADGTYVAQGTYRSPAGTETVDVTLVLSDDLVAEVRFSASSPSPKSQMFQKKFSEGIEQAVVGKSIDSLALSVVNGSSLTPIGFMDALAKIKLQAAA